MKIGTVEAVERERERERERESYNLNNKSCIYKVNGNISLFGKFNDTG